LAIPGISGNYKVNADAQEREPVITTVATIVGIDGEAENRALQVLFMATSPLNISPVLDFEAEEARILEATARQPLALTVQESGCLSELGYLID
jgi:hypothetical protein